MAGSSSPTASPGSEHGISAFLVIIIFLYGWVKSYEQTQNIKVRDVIEGGSALPRIGKLVVKMFLPYLEVWVIVVAGLMVMFSVDKILVTIISLSNGSVTLGDAYATRIFLACFKQWQILGAILTAMGLIVALTVGFLMWLQLQDAPSEALMAQGLSMINVFGLLMALNLIIIQGFISRP